MISASVSCGETEAVPSDSTEMTAAPLNRSETLGFAAGDNGGRKFTMLIPEHAAYEYDVDEETGELMNDAVFRRNRNVEEYLGIGLDFVVKRDIEISAASMLTRFRAIHQKQILTAFSVLRW